MPTISTIKLIEDKIQLIENEGFGEIIIKVRNGIVWRVISSVDILLDKQPLDKFPD